MTAPRSALMIALLLMVAATLVLLGARPPAMQTWNMAVGWEAKVRAARMAAEYLSVLAAVSFGVQIHGRNS